MSLNEKANLGITAMKRLIARVAGIIASDYDYIYDPEHTRRPEGGGWEKTDKGWSKGLREKEDAVPEPTQEEPLPQEEDYDDDEEGFDYDEEEAARRKEEVRGIHGYVVSRIGDVGDDFLHQAGQSLKKQLDALAAQGGSAKALCRDTAQMEAELNAEKEAYLKDIGEEKRLLGRTDDLSKDLYRQTQQLARYRIPEEKYREAEAALKRLGDGPTSGHGSGAYREQQTRLEKFRPQHEAFEEAKAKVEQAEKELEGASLDYKKKNYENVQKYGRGQKGWGKAQELGIRAKNIERLKERQKQMEGVVFVDVEGNADRLLKEFRSPRCQETIARGIYNAVNRGTDGGLAGAAYNDRIQVNEWDRVLEDIEATVPALVERLDLMGGVAKLGERKKDGLDGETYIDMSDVKAEDLVKIMLSYIEKDITGTTVLALKNMPSTVRETGSDDDEKRQSVFEKRPMDYGRGEEDHGDESAEDMFQDAVKTIEKNSVDIAGDAAEIVRSSLPKNHHYNRMEEDEAAQELSGVLKKLFGLFGTSLKSGKMLEPKEAKKLIRTAVGGVAQGTDAENDFDIVATVLYHTAMAAFCEALQKGGSRLPMVEAVRQRAEKALENPEEHLIASRRFLMSRCMFLREQPDYGEREYP